MNTDDIQIYGESVEWDKMHDALVKRAQSSDPKAMLALAKTDEEAKVAIEVWLGMPLKTVNMGCVSDRSGTMDVKHIHVFAEQNHGVRTGNIRVYGYCRGLKRRDKLTPSFELALDTESAKLLAAHLLEQCGCKPVTEYDDLDVEKMRAWLITAGVGGSFGSTNTPAYWEAEQVIEEFERRVDVAEAKRIL